MPVQSYSSLSVRVPTELSDMVKALVARRTAEAPFRRYSLGDALRELLLKGLEVTAQEEKKKKAIAG